MKNTNNTLNDKVNVPRNKRFKGNKRTRYSKSNNANKRNTGPKGPVVTSFKDIGKIFNKESEIKIDLNVKQTVEVKEKSFEEKYADKIKDPRNYGVLDSFVLLNPELISDIIINPEAFFESGVWFDDDSSIEKFIITQAAVTLYKVFWTKELTLDATMPDPEVLFNASKNTVKVDILSAEVRNKFIKTIELKCMASSLKEEDQAFFKNTLDDFIFNKAASFGQKPKKAKPGILKTLKDFSIIGLF